MVDALFFAYSIAMCSLDACDCARALELARVSVEDERVTAATSSRCDDSLVSPGRFLMVLRITRRSSRLPARDCSDEQDQTKFEIRYNKLLNYLT
jgi:hypothetical protein